jgi:hypothetical protein
VTTVVYLYTTPSSERYVLARGHVGRWFRDRGIPALRSPMNGGYWIRKERADEVEAMLDRAGVLVRWIDGDPPPYVPPELVDPDLGSVA